MLRQHVRVVCFYLAICAAQTAVGQIVLPSRLFDDGSASSISCTARGQYYDESVLGCNYCVAGYGMSTISDMLLVGN